MPGRFKNIQHLRHRFFPAGRFLRIGMLLLLAGCLAVPCLALNDVRRSYPLNGSWRTQASDSTRTAIPGFEQVDFNDQNWMVVGVPHNWDTYEGYRRMKHGNRHGTAWYRKTFSVPAKATGKRYFLCFEGVGSYATVWLNGRKIGYHAGGRTTFTVDATAAIFTGKPNVLAVQADHPAFIQDLPWVCGGCSEEAGFSEGSQPMGIFRPVSLIITDEVRVEPFGVHIWNDTVVSESAARVFLTTEIKNYGSHPRNIRIASRLEDASGKVVAAIQSERSIATGSPVIIAQDLPVILHPHLWSPGHPYLYTLVTEVTEDGKVLDAVRNTYGIRTIRWDINRKDTTSRFYVNGQPVFINGTAEYEHRMGSSGAFEEAEIKARVSQLKAAGFNAFRDAHQPHNLSYQEYWDKDGILWWPQLTAHIWYNTPAFRNNFKSLLRDWVKERRNSPSVILWGLQNESKLPADFARECSAIIRELDPTASSQRKITTCNGGEGTDWDVPQNWTGTYGGDPATYASDICRQQLVGEYGAWRSIGLHAAGPYTAGSSLTEDRMTELMETKVRLAESVRDKTCGHFHWLLYSHENPGRAQSGEGFRELDRIGPVNYKGLFTAWGEPTDAFYMYRSNYAPKESEPMVYIVSHTWPDRWLRPGIRDSIIVYSNCDEVELFNGSHSLGRKKRGGPGTHFTWNGADIRYNTLSAVGIVNGKIVPAYDRIRLHHLPPEPASLRVGDFTVDGMAPLPGHQPEKGYHYLYRVNCGGPETTDGAGNTWSADRHKTGAAIWGSLSWADDYTGIDPYFASQRTFDNQSRDSKDQSLYQTFRYGRDRLRYVFPVPDGDYLLELYFIEPWYGAGGSLHCEGWRVFDVAINGKTVIKDLDIWKESGYGAPLIRKVKVHITGGQLVLSFPSVKAGQALISAIAIATKDKKVQPAPPSPSLITRFSTDHPAAKESWSVQEWMNTGDQQYTGVSDVTFSHLPPALFGAAWIRKPRDAGSVARFTLSGAADVYIGVEGPQRPDWLKEFADTKTVIENDDTAHNRFAVFTKRFPAGATVSLTGGKGLNYIIAARPVTTIDPAFDLKPTVSYKTDKASISGAAIVRDSVLGRGGVITFKESSSGSRLLFAISVGVGSQYALRFRYFNPTGKTRTAGMKLLAADGSLMKSEALSFPPSTNGKWNTLYTSTGTSINAGAYTIILTAEDAAGLSISGLEVQ